MVVPARLKLPVEMAVNNRLVKELKRDDFDLKRFEKQLKSAVSIEVDLDMVTLNYLVDQRLTAMMKKLEQQPEDLTQLRSINKMLQIAEETPINPEKWQSQNITFRIKEEQYQEMLKRSNSGDEEAAEWVKAFHELEESVNLVVE